MITQKRFFKIKEEVEQAVVELFDYAKAHSNDYVLLLADAEFNKSYKSSWLQPHVLASQVDYYKENTRLEFAMYFLNRQYNLGTGKDHTIDEPFGLQLEMMIYCHIWESNRYLKQLYRLQQLVNGGVYSWKVEEIPDTSKHLFIRTTIRDGFKNKGLKVAEIMTKGFHTSLRNSFLHSEFEIDEASSLIHLHTQRQGKLQSFELSNISFNDWTERFLYSVFLNYFFIKEKEKRRKNVIKDFGKDEFLIAFPKIYGSRYFITTRKIYYDESRQAFYFERSAVPYTPSDRGPETATTGFAATVAALDPVISKEKLQEIDQHVGAAVIELLKALHTASEEQYIAWLFDVTVDKATGVYISRPHAEITRLNFSAMLLDSLYIKPGATMPELIRLQMEMMIYCHIWESRPFLKQLRAAARILSADTVNWDEDPQADRHQLVDSIVQKLWASKLDIADCIVEGFHTSLRNAFAHSDFEIDVQQHTIHLDTYDPNQDWDIPSISFFDWMKKFLISLSLDYQLIMAKEALRAKIPAKQLQQVLDNMNKTLTA